MMQTSVVSKQIASANTNRERKQKYNHPKGAPDADLIFGVRYLIYKTVSDYFIEFFFFKDAKSEAVVAEEWVMKVAKLVTQIVDMTMESTINTIKSCDC